MTNTHIHEHAQWNQFYDFSLAYPTLDALLKQGGSFEEDSSCKRALYTIYIDGRMDGRALLYSLSCPS